MLNIVSTFFRRGHPFFLGIVHDNDHIIAVFDEDGTRDAAVTNLDLPRPTFRARDLHNQPT